jgi:hypothetical protein
VDRREFLAGLAALGWTTRIGAASRLTELRADVVIVGGGLGGCAAALAAARAGCSVLLTEETDWIGGQLTSQAVPPDEHPWIESFGASRSYRRLRSLIRDYYRTYYPLTSAARDQENLNPGNGLVSPLCHEPRVALAVLEGQLAPYRSSGRLTVLLNHRATSAERDGDRVRAVEVRHVGTHEACTLAAPYFLDATELGDLLPLAGCEHVMGTESQAETGEPHAPSKAAPLNQQAFTFCLAIDYEEGRDHTIDRPAEYDFWRRYVPDLHPAWPGPLLSWQVTHPISLRPRTLAFDPRGESGPNLNLWLYRRIADRRNSANRSYASDVCLVNWPQNDYWLGPLCGISAAEAAHHQARARQLSLSLLYWMQTEAPRPDGKTGWRGLHLRPDVVGTVDGLAKSPYVRESRRIQAEFTVLEQHAGTEARMKLTGKSLDEVRAETFSDAVGVGSYRIDLHPTSGGNNYLDVSSLPFQIPLGSLLPQRIENLLPACKNLGVTHITNGCYRLHPVEWNIGEAAGALAAFCLSRKEQPRRVRANARLLGDFQRTLRADGVELAWPRLAPR